MPNMFQYHQGHKERERVTQRGATEFNASYFSFYPKPNNESDSVGARAVGMSRNAVVRGPTVELNNVTDSVGSQSVGRLRNAAVRDLILR